MTPRPLPRERLAQLLPSLLESQALVALVPATANLPWAAGVAWEVARAAAVGGRRVALVDLWIEEPRLHEVVGVAPSDGIVDAFEYGVSLTKAAHDVGGVHFIPAGSYTARAADIFAHERWLKLHAGFRSEGALLLLFLTPGGLARLSALPDGVIALAPDGFDPSAAGPGLGDALGRGAPLLGVVREQWAAPAPPPGPAPRRPVPRRARRRAPLVLAALAVATGVGGWALLGPGDPRTRADAAEAPESAAAEPAAAPAVPPSSRAADTLPWTVQLAAYGTLERALRHADRLAAEDLETVVSPVTAPGAPTVWYRVMAGAYPSRDSAATARAALWRRGFAAEGVGDLVRTPFTLALFAGADIDALRRRGIPAMRAHAGHVLVGAFETPEQAAPARGQLAAAGVEFALVTRMATTP